MRFPPCLLVMVMAFGFLLANAQSASACPNCKEAVANQTSDQANVASGYNYSVMFMVSVPFTLLGTGAFAVVRTARRGGIPEL